MVRYIPLHSYDRNERIRRRDAAWLQLTLGAGSGLMIGVLLALPFLLP